MSCIKTLKEQGLKLTPQRRLIVDVIHDTSVHLTADEIIAQVQARMPEVHKSTIYHKRVLRAESSVPNGKDRFAVRVCQD